MRTTQSIAAFALICSLLMLSAPSAQAQKTFDLNASIPLDIPAQPLESALLELAKQGAFQLVISAGTFPDHVIAPLAGTIPIKAALDRLLQGTDLGYKWIGEHTITVAPLLSTQ